MIDQNILITTKDFTTQACEYYKHISRSLEITLSDFNLVIEVDENIDNSGNVIELLAENEINRVLRLVFQEKHANIFICLKNAFINPLHEKTILNLLTTAGYQNVNASHKSE